MIGRSDSQSGFFGDFLYDQVLPQDHLLRKLKELVIALWLDARFPKDEILRMYLDTVYFGHLHSNPIMLAVIWGIPGFLLAMGFFLATLVQPWRRWHSLQGASSRPPPWRAGWILGAIGAGAGFFVAGLTEWYFGDAESMLLFLAILGTALTRDPGTEE